MQDANPVQRLRDSGPDLEIWWDSSPLIYENWLVGPGKPHADAGLFRTNPTDPLARLLPESVLQGTATDQPLTWQVIDAPRPQGGVRPRAGAAEPGRYARSPVAALRRGGRTGGRHGWRRSSRRRGADQRPDLLPGGPPRYHRRRRHGGAGVASSTQRGRTSGQMPGSSAGIEGVRLLTAEACRPTSRSGFTVPASGRGRRGRQHRAGGRARAVGGPTCATGGRRR